MHADESRDRPRLAGIAPIAIAAILSLAGCASTSADDGAPDVHPSSSSSAAPTASEGSDESGHVDGGEDDHPSVPVPEAAPESQTDALVAATAALTAFARPSMPEQQWWAELLPLLSQKGAVAYEGTLPSNIPVSAVTGTPAVLEASTDVATLVEVPTDAGAYIVTLVRGSTEEPWLAERIRPAGQ